MFPASNSLGASLWASGVRQVTSHFAPYHREHIFTPAAQADRGAFFQTTATKYA